MSNHPIIAALRAALESERLKLANAHAKHPIQDNHAAVIYAHEAATERLMTIIEKAVDVIEKYADGRAFDFSRTVRGEINFDHALSSATAKQFLTTLADASGESKNES